MKRRSKAGVKKNPLEKIQPKERFRLVPEAVTNNKYFFLILPVFYFIVVGYFSYTNHTVGDYGVETDFFWDYVPQAKEVLNGIMPIDEFRGPGYPLILALVSIPFKSDFHLAGIFLNVLCASIILYLLLKTVTKIANRETAFICALFVSTNSYFLKYSYSCGTDMLFMVFYFSAIYFLFRNEEVSIKDLCVAGVFCGFAYITRYTGLALMIAIPVVFILWRKKNITNKKYLLKGTGVFFLMCGIFVAVWGIICLMYKGKFFYNHNFQNTAYTLYKPEYMSRDEWKFNHSLEFDSFFDVINYDPGVFFKKVFWDNLTSYFLMDMHILLPVYSGIAVSIGLVIFFMKYRFRTEKEKSFFVINLIFFSFLLLIFYSERFSLPILPFYIFIALKITELKVISKIPKRICFVFTLVLLSYTIYNSYTFISNDVSSGPKEMLSYRDWAEKNLPGERENRITMSRKPHISYYLNTKFERVPFVRTYEELLTEARNAKADYLYLGPLEVSLIGNQFSYLLNPLNCPKELEVLTYTTDPPTVLYKVN